MKPIKRPNWINWITEPVYCLKWLQLHIRRLTRTKSGRLKIWLFFKRNALVGSVILLTIQISNEREWRREAEQESFEVKNENNFIRGVISMRNSDFRNFPLAWWEKVKIGKDWRLLDLNLKYEAEYHFLKSESLGKTNEDFFGEEIGKHYSEGDLEVWLTPEKELFKIENTNKGAALIFKYGRLSILNDSISSGFSMPLKEIEDAIDNYKKKQ